MGFKQDPVLGQLTCTLHDDTGFAQLVGMSTGKFT